jgi:hypothetical protein
VVEESLGDDGNDLLKTDFQLASNVAQAGPAVYGAFDGSWRPIMPVFEPYGTVEYRLVHSFLSYLYCELSERSESDI